MINSICVVCVGNICRSPIGERLLKKYLPQKNIISAGIAAMVGQGADPKSVSVSIEHELSLDNHIAQQLTKSLCDEQDLILVMEKKHIDAVCRIAPEVRGKVMLYGYWINQMEISDPYRKDISFFERTYSLLEQSANQWIEKLNK